MISEKLTSRNKLLYLRGFPCLCTKGGRQSERDEMEERHGGSVKPSVMKARRESHVCSPPRSRPFLCK